MPKYEFECNGKWSLAASVVGCLEEPWTIRRRHKDFKLCTISETESSAEEISKIKILTMPQNH